MVLNRYHATVAFLLLLMILISAGCHHTNRLAEYDFDARSVTMITTIPTRPDVFTGDFFFFDKDRPLKFFANVGSSVVKEAEAEKARVRMDSAYQCIDVNGILKERTLDQVGLHLGAFTVEDPSEADYLIDLLIVEFGIDAKSWDANAFFKLKADVQLIDRANKRLVWETGFEETEQITPGIWGPVPGVRNVLTAAALANLTVEEMAVILENLVYFSADRITRRLQDDWYESR